MSWLGIISSLLSLLRWFANWIEGEKNRQAGRDEVTAQVNREAADAQERMATVDDNPSDDTVAGRLRDGSFLHSGENQLPDDQVLRQVDTKQGAARIPTFARWFRN